MAKERCLKKSFKDSLEDIKERMKEKKNKKWAKLGKSNQVLSVKGKIADNSFTQMKSFQANNRALALALEEEKSKMREAQDTILNLKKEYQCLKFQMFALQRKLVSQQGKEHAETRLIALKIISKVVQNLLNVTNLLGPEKDLHTTVFNQTLCASDIEECDSSSLRKQDSLQGVENTSSATPPQINIGLQSSSCEDHVWHESRNEEDRQFGNSLPKTVSTRCRYRRLKTQNEQCVSEGSNPEVIEQIKECCQQDEYGPESCLEKNDKEQEETYVSQGYKHDINTDKTLGQSNMLTESNILAVISEQTDFNTIGGSQMLKERGQKRKLETIKNSSRTRSKKERNYNKQRCAKEKTDTSLGSSDAYDFTFEESVHITPFRQNKDEENNISDKNYIEAETSSSESFVSEDSDDSLYIPYIKKSKSRKSLGCRTDVSPVHTRPQSKKAVYEQHDRNTEGGNRSTKTENSTDKETVATDNAFGTLEKGRPCLGDITNFASTSTSTQTRVSHPLISDKAKDMSQQKRRCTLCVSYKEPSISVKLRRGDRFTDTGFLNSPIFKQKKSSKRKSVEKK
ncbi:shugoshin 1 [Rhineura floridana]|uniref:shugoshin 1 n=1 Tax=Rhineura floridana TaxID=261503 RepID=UPI002AC7F773|nr:shugoshin 1 [Rhineura floridana]